MEDVKLKLLQVRFMADELQQLYAVRAGIYQMLTGTTPVISPTGTRGGGDVHRMDALAELTDCVDEKIDALAALRTETVELIYLLEDPRQRSVLLAYYVNCDKPDGSAVSWDDVADALHLSRRQVMRLHAEAISALEKMALNVTREAWYSPS